MQFTQPLSAHCARSREYHVLVIIKPIKLTSVLIEKVTLTALRLAD